jgi:hypothetical protein
MKTNSISQERFEKAKKKIIKKYPGAHTRIDPNGKYFVATENGRDINNLQIGQTMDAYEFEDEDDLYGFNAALNKITTIPPQTHKHPLFDLFVNYLCHDHFQLQQNTYH